MKTIYTWLAVGLTWVAAASLMAQDAPAKQKRATADSQAVANATQLDKIVGLREQLRRVTAALAVVEKSDSPDSRRIANLTRRKEMLQAQLIELGVGPDEVGQAEQAAVQGGAGVCPFGFAPQGPGPRAGWGGGGWGNCPWNGAGGNSGQLGAGPGYGQGPPPWAGGGGRRRSRTGSWHGTWWSRRRRRVQAGAGDGAPVAAWVEVAWVEADGARVYKQVSLQGL